MKAEFIRKGTKIIEYCLDNCKSLQLDVNVKIPSQNIIDMLLSKDYLKLRFNSPNPNDDILIFHNSGDKYSHNGDISFTCFLSQAPKVLKQVRKHKKVIALIKELKGESK